MLETSLVYHIIAARIWKSANQHESVKKKNIYRVSAMCHTVTLYGFKGEKYTAFLETAHNVVGGTPHKFSTVIVYTQWMNITKTPYFNYKEVEVQRQSNFPESYRYLDGDQKNPDLPISIFIYT